MKNTCERVTFTAENLPKVINKSILIPFKNLKKKKEPIEKLRRILLLIATRKILAISLLNRIFDGISKLIPPSQTAYQPGRGTTEDVMTCKLLIEKAINFFH